MNARKLILSTLLLSFLLVQGCGSGGGDFVDGVYTGPTAPAALSDGDMDSLSGELDQAGGASITPLTMGAMALIEFFTTHEITVLGVPLVGSKSIDGLQTKGLPEAVARAVKARVLGAGEKATVTLDRDLITLDMDDVIDLTTDGGTGWIYIGGSASVRMADTRVTVAGDVTIEFHNASFYGAQVLTGLNAAKGPASTVDGTVRLILGGAFSESVVDETLESVLLNASLRCEAQDLRFTGYFDEGSTELTAAPRVEELPYMDTYIGNGYYAIGVTGEMDPDAVDAALTISSDMTTTRESAGEQFRFVAAWTLRAAALTDILLDGLSGLVVSKDLATPFPLSTLSLNAAGTLYSTRLGGSVQFSTTSEFAPEVPELYLHTLVSWNGGALRMGIAMFDYISGGADGSVEVEADFEGNGTFVPESIEPYFGVFSFTLGFLPYAGFIL